jgi:DNA repair exonuclease SbcCD ATPase subunit
MENPNGKIMFAWLIGLFLFLWMGYFGGYFVATNEAMDALKQREGVWESKVEAHKGQITSAQAEVAKAESAATEARNEMIGLQKQVRDLKRELDQVKMETSKEVHFLVEKITNLEEVLSLKADEVRKANQKLAQGNMNAAALADLESPLTVKEIVTAKQSFNEIQHEVAAGNFKGLNLTIGYQRLRTIFDNPEMDRVLGIYDTAKGDSQ